MQPQVPGSRACPACSQDTQQTKPRNDVNDPRKGFPFLERLRRQMSAAAGRRHSRTEPSLPARSSGAQRNTRLPEPSWHCWQPLHTPRMALEDKEPKARHQAASRLTISVYRASTWDQSNPQHRAEPLVTPAQELPGAGHEHPSPPTAPRASLPSAPGGAQPICPPAQGSIPQMPSSLSCAGHRVFRALSSKTK